MVRRKSDRNLPLSGTVNPQSPVGDFEGILITLLYTNTIHSYSVIGTIFGISSRTTVKKCIDKWLPLLGELGDMMSSYMDLLDENSINQLEPSWYKKMNLRKVGSLVDGKDFMSETYRENRVLNLAQASNKMKHSAFRILTWSLPCGAVIERTPTFLGRASEKSILRAWGDTGRLLLPPGYSVLGDKGFDNTASSYSNYNLTLHPSFLTNAQFSRGQVNHNVEICKKRYTCEVVYSRVAVAAKLRGVLPREHFHNFNFEYIVAWAHGRANICYGYLQKMDSDLLDDGDEVLEELVSNELNDDDGEKSSLKEPIGLAVIKATTEKRDELKTSLSDRIDFSKISFQKLAKDQDLSKE